MESGDCHRVPKCQVPDISSVDVFNPYPKFSKPNFLEGPSWIHSTHVEAHNYL